MPAGGFLGGHKRRPCIAGARPPFLMAFSLRLNLKIWASQAPARASNWSISMEINREWTLIWVDQNMFRVN